VGTPSQRYVAVALASFEKAAAKDPRLVEARFQIAQISMGYKDFRKAIANYQAVTEVDPKNAAGFVNLGVALKGAGQFQDAEKAYLRAIELGKHGFEQRVALSSGVCCSRTVGRPGIIATS